MAILLANRQVTTGIYFHSGTKSDENEVSSSDLESALCGMLNGFYGMYSKIAIRPMSSVQKYLNIVADIIFRAYDDAILAVQALNDGVYKEWINEPILVPLGHSRTIRCKRQVYIYVVGEIDRLREGL